MYTPDESTGDDLYLARHLGIKGWCLPLYKVADTTLYYQGDDYSNMLLLCIDLHGQITPSLALMIYLIH